MTWDSFYERFFDLTLNTQKAYSYKLNDYGPSDEVFEVLSEFAFYDQKFATRFASRALDNDVHFTPEQVLEMTILIEKPVLSRMAETANPPFDKEQLEEIYMLIDDDVFERISKKQKIDIFSEDDEEDLVEPEVESYVEYAVPPQKKAGIFSTLLALAAGIGLAEGMMGKRHNGRCNGDCAHCPPHYGYRYVRWYYGHDHQYGCEFGGNRGSGQRD